jgi:NhaP-type Na+/H+ or K+/H+ antiporter
MKAELLYLIIGVLLVLVALSGTVVKRLPFTPTMVYLGLGLGLGPVGLGLFLVDPLRHAPLLEHAAEVAVIISLFTTGLKLRVPLWEKIWTIPIRLAFVSMTITVGLVALVAFYALGLPAGAAILLGAILAPTDPVLASEVQLRSAADSDKLRFSITGEAGLNDGTAFPFVMLGLGLLGLHELGDWGWRWVAVDVIWAVAGGLALGGAAGWLLGRAVLYLRREHKEALGLDEFLALGLIASVYGAALLLHTYGFLAVFAAGLALRSIERKHTGEEIRQEQVDGIMSGGAEERATDPEQATTHMAESLLGFNEQMERVFEVGVVLVIGAMLTPQLIPWEDFWFVAVLFLLIRPVAVLTGTIGRKVGTIRRGMISWFGIRGIGSLYYLMYAVNKGLPEELAMRLISLTFCVIAVSVIVHGISVTPLMAWYRSRQKSKATSA